MSKIYLAGYFRKNLGDDLFVKTIANRYPTSSITILVEPKFTEPYVDMPNVKVVKYVFYRRLLNKLLSIIGVTDFIERKLISRNDLIVEIGGSIFQQIAKEGITSRRLNYLKSNKPIFIIGSNFGPYTTDDYYKTYKEYFSKVNSVVFRDEESFSLFREIPVVDVAPDVVLGLPITKSNNEIVQHKKKLAVVSIINIVDKVVATNKNSIQNSYDRKIKELILQLIKRNYTIVLFGFSEAENDTVAANRIFSSIPSHVRNNVLLKSHDNINDSLDILQKADIMFSSRFHAMILGWRLQIPQYVFSYSQKTNNVIRDLFPVQANIDVRQIADIDAEFLIDNVNTMDKKTLENVSKSAEIQFKFVDQFFKNNS
ncbi:MAG: polysaccharide pyruvyl transferase family protein [Leuconostoc mesenteroides]|jgi:colanic acid/amylovoran biosynthesis protein|nr:polysaccharide pyruvyl transferase family protein [Leuconostoc mesenteroides]MCI1878159.1 polysaccharide pyruvyl transferase family protein [Leuconostoc mesenteroides]MCI1907700.1 polysaccharide pyruvyl transferase family protein [Leuconostoc mesenteroides]